MPTRFVSSSMSAGGCPSRFSALFSRFSRGYTDLALSLSYPIGKKMFAGGCSTSLSTNNLPQSLYLASIMLSVAFLFSFSASLARCRSLASLSVSNLITSAYNFLACCLFRLISLRCLASSLS